MDVAVIETATTMEDSLAPMRERAIVARALMGALKDLNFTIDPSSIADTKSGGVSFTGTSARDRLTVAVLPDEETGHRVVYISSSFEANERIAAGVDEACDSLLNKIDQLKERMSLMDVELGEVQWDGAEQPPDRETARCRPRRGDRRTADGKRASR